jgi:hypothetical protein
MAGHGDRSSVDEAGRGEVVGAAGWLRKSRHGAEGVTGRVAVHEGGLYSHSRARHGHGRGGGSTASGARVAVASPRLAGRQGIEHVAAFGLVIFKR